MSARKYTLEDIWSLAVGHRWLILLPIAIGLAAAPLLARLVPLRYRSEAVILVVPPQVAENYVQTTVKKTVEERLSSITAAILSRSRLEEIILDMDLYKEERKREVMQDVVERMRLRDVKTSATGRDVDSFRVGYVSDDPRTAQEVTRRLTDLYIDQNVTERNRQAESTKLLISTQLEDTKKRLSEQEKRLETYRRAHPGQLPSQLDANVQSIQNANMLLQNLNESTNRAAERRLRIERDIAALEAIPVPQEPGPASANAAVPPTTAELLEVARTRLGLLQQRYLPGHPTLQEAERTVADLTEKLQNEAPLSARTTAIEKPMSPAEAKQQQRRLQLAADLEGVDLQLNQNQAEEARLKRLIVSYQAKVDAVPTRESELVELTREYTTLNAAYSDLLLKRENASLASNLERRQAGEQFTILDPPSRPERPYNKVQHFASTGAGALVGLVLAIVVLGLREYRDSSFRSKDEVVSALSLPVLASIPLMASARERKSAARRRWIMDLGGSAVILAAVAVVVVWRLYS